MQKEKAEKIKTGTAIKELEEREQKKENEFNNRKKQTENRKHGKG